MNRGIDYMVGASSEETRLVVTLLPNAMAVLEQAAEAAGVASVDALLHTLLTEYCQTDGIYVEIGEQLNPRLAVSAEIYDGKLWVTLTDESVIATPLYWYPFLTSATPEQQINITVYGTSIFWPDLQDGVSVEGLIRGPNDYIKAIIAARREDNPNLLLPGF